MAASRAPVAAFLIGALVGAVAVIAFRPGEAAAPSAAPDAAAGPMRPVPASMPSDGSARAAAPDPEPGATPAPRQLVAAELGSAELQATLRPFVEGEIRRGWSTVRDDAMPADLLEQTTAQCLEAIERMPFAYGERAAREFSEQEKAAAAFAGGDGVALLRALEGDEPGAAEFVRSPRFAELFRPRGGGTSLAGPGRAPGDKLPDGAVLAYPAGVFAVSDLSNGNEPFPSDVTLRGVGMDATLLVLDANRARSPLQRFAIEDCTVFCDNAITDVRSAPAVLSLRRVRVVGFDCGAGGSVAFYLFGGAALSAIDTRFEGGYGSSPGGYANLMRTSGPVLARFERCTFERMSLDDARARTIVFDGCTMHELLDAAPRGPSYVSCRITLCDQERKWQAEYRRRDLNDLFPQWRELQQGR